MKKILSIDGGGMRSLIPGRVLVELEHRMGRPLADLFDMIAGTSAGGLLAILSGFPDAEGRPAISATEILNVYPQERNDVFDRSLWRTLATLGGLTDELYDSESLERAYVRRFGATRFGDLLMPTLVSTYDLERRQPFFFRSWEGADQQLACVDVALAMTAAPTYYAPKSLDYHGRSVTLIDGAVFANNPTMCAYVEARQLFPDEDLLCVSLGTGEMTKPIPYEDAKDWGLADWAVPILKVVFDGVNDAVHHQTSSLLGEHYFRFQLQLSGASEELDDCSDENIEALLREGDRLIAAEGAQLDRLCGMLAGNTTDYPNSLRLALGGDPGRVNQSWFQPSSQPLEPAGPPTEPGIGTQTSGPPA